MSTLRHRCIALVASVVLVAAGAVTYSALNGNPGPTRAGHRHRAVISAAARTGLTTRSVTGSAGAGTDLWTLTTAGNLFLSTDGGSTWQQATLPVSLVGEQANAPGGFAVAQFGTSTVWLVAPDGGQEELFVSDDAGKSWAPPAPVVSRPSLSPEDQQALSGAGTGPDIVYAQLLSPTLGFIAYERSVFATFAIATLDISTNGGQSFRTTILPTFGPVELDSATVGYVVGGPGNQRAYETTDGGTSWAPLDVAGPTTENWRLGLPMLSGSNAAAVVPLYVSDGQGGTVLHSVEAVEGTPSPHTAAAGIAHALGAPVHVAGPTGGILVTKMGSDVVAFTSRGTHSYRSENRGASWTASTSTGLPTGWSLRALVSTSTQSVVARVTERQCAAKSADGKNIDCTEQSALFSTTAAGGAWSRIDV